MKILYVTEYFPHENITGGVEARAYYLSKHLAKNHDVAIICSRQEGQPEESEINGCKVYRVGKKHPYSHKGSFLSRLSFVKAAKEKGEELDFDLVDGQSFLSYPPAHAIAEEAGKKKVATYHETWVGDWIEYKGVLTGIGGELWERLALGKDWDQIISVSEFTKERLAERSVDQESIQVVPNGVELKQYEEVEAEDFDRPTICTVSRLTETKKIDVVMKAFERVSEEIPDAQLKVVGKGPEAEKLKSLSQELDADIELLGYLPNKKDVIKVLKSSHIFVSASTLEGFGMSVIEATAAGTPYVASEIEPYVEVTRGETGGLIFHRNDQSDLKEKVQMLLENEGIYLEKKKECKKLAESYEWKKLTEKVEDIYEKLQE